MGWELEGCFAVLPMRAIRMDEGRSMECPMQLVQCHLCRKPQVQVRLLRQHPLLLQRGPVNENVSTTAIACRGDHFERGMPQDTTVVGASENSQSVRYHWLLTGARGVPRQGQRPPHLYKMAPIPPQQTKQRKHGGKGTLGNPAHGAARKPQVQVQPKLHALTLRLGDGDGTALGGEQDDGKAERTTACTRMVGNRIHASQPIFTLVEGRQHPQGTFIPLISPLGERPTTLTAPLQLRHKHLDIHPAGLTVPDLGGFSERSGEPLAYRPSRDLFLRTRRDIPQLY